VLVGIFVSDANGSHLQLPLDERLRGVTVSSW